MIKKRTAIIGGIVLVLVTFVITFMGTSVMFIVGNIPMLFGKAPQTSQQKINQIKNIIDRYYVEPTEDKVLENGMLRGILASLEDPYSRYMDKKQFTEMMQETSSKYAGIGVYVTVDPKDNLITVIAPIEDTPGEKAGLLPGDKIIKVNGQEVWGDKLNEAVDMMKGPPKTDVMLTIVRDRFSKPQDITITREMITIKTVKHEMLEDNIGYIRITHFYETTSQAFNDALDALQAQNMKGLIIDVRNNPGGLLDQVVEIVDRLVPKGIIVYTENREKQRNVWYSDEEELEVPLTVLVNGASASASEILSGAVKDYKQGVLIGTTTFGKGLVQTVFPLNDGSGLSLTTSRYYTPNGISIHGTGVEPDIVQELPEELQTKSLSQITKEEDVQLQKAIDVIEEALKK